MPYDSDDNIVKTELVNWDPSCVDLPDSSEDQVRFVARSAAVGAMKKIVTISAGDHGVDRTPAVLGRELAASIYIVEMITKSAPDGDDWMSDYMRNLVKASPNPNNQLVEPHKDSLVAPPIMHGTEQGENS